MDQKTAAELLERYRQGQCTPAEEAMLYRWYEEEAARQPMASDPVNPLVEEPLLWQRVQDAIQGGRLRQILRRRHWLPYAAAGIIVVFAGIWLALNNGGGGVDGMIATDVAPGGNLATLTLADGRAIDLSADQTRIVIGADGITYSDGYSTVASLRQNGIQDASQPLVLSTPKGGTYAITLPDGTNVWLNAASTLKYPSRFAEDTREVELVGEAYFDVAKDEKRPFRVVSASQAVEVLGTEFNISAYPDEAETKTTLVEGKVRMTLAGAPRSQARTKSIILAPHEQSVVRDGTILKSEVNISHFVAWRDGLIVLDHADLAHVIRQLERWYNVEFVIQDRLPTDIQLSGKLPRNSNLSGIVHALHLNTKMDFTIEGRRVMVAGN